jgi:hypothetical protein
MDDLHSWNMCIVSSVGSLNTGDLDPRLDPRTCDAGLDLARLRECCASDCSLVRKFQYLGPNLPIFYEPIYQRSGQIEVLVAKYLLIDKRPHTSRSQ